MVADTQSFETYIQRAFLSRPDAMAQAIQDQDPVLAGLTRKANMGNDNQVPLMIAPTRGPGSTVAEANTDATQSENGHFAPVARRTYITIKIDASSIEKTATSEIALMELADTEIGAARARMAQHISSAFMGDTGGAIGKVASISTDTITLEDEIPATWINKGAKITASANDGTDAGHALRDGGDAVVLESVDRGTRTLVGETDWTTTITGMVAGDYIFLKNLFKDRHDGLRGFYPQTAPTPGDSHQGLDRSDDAQRLAGFRVNGADTGITSGLTKLGALCTAFQGRPNMGVMHPEKYAKVVDQLGAQALQEERIGNIGFTGVRFVTGAGPAMLFSNPSCDIDKTYLLQTSDWKLHHVGTELIKFRRNDRGGILHYQGGNGVDQFWAFMVAEYNFSCNAPGRGGVVYGI